MVLEKAYTFFNKPGLLKKNEQKVFNTFNFNMLGVEGTEGLADIPLSPPILDYLRLELDPKAQVDLEALIKLSFEGKDNLPELNKSPDFVCPDYLASW